MFPFSNIPGATTTPDTTAGLFADSPDGMQFETSPGGGQVIRPYGEVRRWFSITDEADDGGGLYSGDEVSRETPADAWEVTGLVAEFDDIPLLEVNGVEDIRVGVRVEARLHESGSYWTFSAPPGSGSGCLQTIVTNVCEQTTDVGSGTGSGGTSSVGPHSPSTAANISTPASSSLNGDTATQSGSGTSWSVSWFGGAGQSANVSLAASGTSKSLDATDFAFALPAIAIVRGITVALDAGTSNGSGDTLTVTPLPLSAGASAKTATVPHPAAGVSFGNPTDLWDGTWTPAVVNDPTFGVGLVASSTLGVVGLNIDDVIITVYYDVPDGVGWVGPESAEASDGVSAIATLAAGETSAHLELTEFGFTAPLPGTCTGILVEVLLGEGSDTPKQLDATLEIFGSASGGTKTYLLPAPGAYIPLGAVSDLWGGVWPAAWLEDSSFGVRLTVTAPDGAGAVVYIDHVRLTLYFGGGVIIGGGSSGTSLVLVVEKKLVNTCLGQVLATWCEQNPTDCCPSGSSSTGSAGSGDTVRVIEGFGTCPPLCVPRFTTLYIPDDPDLGPVFGAGTWTLEWVDGPLPNGFCVTSPGGWLATATFEHPDCPGTRVRWGVCVPGPGFLGDTDHWNAFRLIDISDWSCESIEPTVTGFCELGCVLDCTRTEPISLHFVYGAGGCYLTTSGLVAHPPGEAFLTIPVP